MPARPPNPILRPRVLLEREAWKLQHIPKGTIITRHYLPEAFAKRYPVQFLPDGKLRVPRYRLVNGKLEFQGWKDYRDVNAGIRGESHALDGVFKEAPEIRQLFERVSLLHQDVLLNWKRMNPRWRKSQINSLNAAIGQLKGVHPGLKQEAKKELELAVTQLEQEGRYTAASATLVGAFNRLTGRVSYLYAQFVHISRRKRIIQWKRTERDLKLFNQLDQSRTLFHQLGDFRPSIRKESQALIHKIGLQYNFFRARPEIELREETTHHLLEAIQCMRTGNKPGAAIAMAKANHVTTIHLSKTTVLYPDRLDSIAKSPVTEFRAQIVHNQARVFYENIRYWLDQKPTTLQIDKMKQFLGYLHQIAVGEGGKYVGQTVRPLPASVIATLEQANQAFQHNNLFETRVALEKLLTTT